MKVMKLALLGTAALVVASVGARAENLDGLKAQMNSLTLNAVADAPAAATTTVSWSGYVRAGIVTGYTGNPAGLYATDIRAKAGFNVTGKTDTAVGEVGVSISTQADDTSGGFGAYNHANPTIHTDGFSGWWKLTPNVTLTGGVLGTLSKSSYSFDAVCTCAFNDANGAVASGVYGGGDPAAMKLSYADGPLGFAIQVEDANNFGNTSAFGASGKVSYSGDMFGVDVGAGYWGNANPAQQAAWAVTAGVGGKFGMFSLGVAGGMGSGIGATDDYTKVSGYAKASLSDSAGIELGVTHQWDTQLTNADYTEFDAGLYYTPVKQLTIGLEGMYNSAGTGAGVPVVDGSYTGALFTVFRF